MLTPDRMLDVLTQYPFPGASDVRSVALGCHMVIAGQHLVYGDGEWLTGDCRKIPATWPAFDSPDDGDRVHAEIRRVLAALDGDRRKDVEAQLAKMTDAHAVVSQRLIGAQKEVAEVTTQRDEIAAAHSALHTESEARRRVDLRAVKAFTTIAEVFGVDPADVGKVCEVVADQRRRVPELERERDEALARADKMTAQAKEMRVSFAEFERRGQQIESDDELREQIAVAVGLDDSASLALILDTVARDRPGREISRLSGLLDVLAAPVAFGERRLSTAERAEWALRRRLTEGKECSARMAQLIDAEVYLDVLGVPAYAAVPSDDPGDASEALTVAERLRLHFGARS